MSKQQQITKDFLSAELKTGAAQTFLQVIDGVVSKYSGERIQLKKVEKYKFRVGSLKDTSYKKYPDLLEEWEQFYLPDEMKMRVIGVLENFPCAEDSAELVLMVCEDGNVFAYEDQRLHLVASSLKVLFESGVQFPSKKYFYRGQSFEDMATIDYDYRTDRLCILDTGELQTKSDWDEVKKSKEGMKKREEHQRMLESIKPTLLKNLKSFKKGQRGAAASAGKERGDPQKTAC